MVAHLQALHDQDLECVGQHYTLWAPMWHDLYPNSKFYRDTCPMPSMVMHFMYVMLAWPDVKPVLTAALAAPALTLKGRVVLEDFRFLCEYAIPHVRSPLTVRFDSLL